MQQTNKNISAKTKINLYLNLINLLPYLVLIFSGIILQSNYHMHHLPDEYCILGLGKLAWLQIHKIATGISFPGVIVHCIMHWKYIKATTKIFWKRNSKVKVIYSYYLLIVGILTTIPAMFSWILLQNNSHLRAIFIEIHDKLAILFMILSVIHLISRTGWMIKTLRRIRA